jgi:phage recombination protein Bet
MSSQAVATITHAPTRSVLVTMSTRYGMEPAAFEATLRKTVCKGEVSREEFAAFLLVAQEYGLNPLTKELYAFPAKGGGIQPIVSIDGWARIINDHPAFDGMEFEDIREGENVIAITCRMFRKDRSRPVEATEYQKECARNTDVWRQWPRRMLRHKSMIQCARYAFGFSGIMDPDEYERASAAPRQGDPTAPRQLHAGFDAPAAETPAHDPETGEITDAQVEPIDAPAEDALPVRDDTATEDFPGDAPVEPAKPSLAERVAAFKARCDGKGTVKLMSLWAASSELRSDLDASDPDALVEMTDWWQARFEAAEADEKGG